MILSLLFLMNFHVNAAARDAGALAKLKLTPFTQLDGRFKQTKKLQELDVEINTEGNFEVVKVPNGANVFRWNIEKPKPSKICIDGTGLVIESGEGAALKKKSFKFTEVGKEAGDQIASLIKLITMEPAKIVEEFEITEKSGNYLLTPKNKQGAFFETAEVTVASGLLKNVIITEKSKDQIRLQFTDLKTKNSGPIAAEKSLCAR